MSKPFFLKSGADGRHSRTSSLTSDTDENTHFQHNTSNHEPENWSDSEGCSWKNLGDINGSQGSSTPRSLSPLSSLSGGDGHLPTRASDFLDEPFNVPHYIRTPSPGLRPSTSLLEVSIASLPPESELKQALINIRKQMANSLVRLKELEEQVKNVPTLQVRISVLQEEKRQLIKQLQSKSVRKRTRSSSADYSVYNNVHSRGSKSDTENDNDDDYALLKKRLRVKLNSVGVGDCSVSDTICSRCKKNPPIVKKSVKSVCIGTDSDITGTWHSGEGSQQFSTTTAKSNHEIWRATRKNVQTRSIGVGMMRSFTRDFGVGDGRPILYTEQRGVQSSVAMEDFSCDAPSIHTADAAVMAKPSLDSVGTNTVPVKTDDLLNEETVTGTTRSSASGTDVGVQTSGGLGVSLVSIGVGVCTTDDEPVCRRCANRKSRAIVKTVDEIMANRIDIPLCKSVGVGDMSLDDKLFCDRCSNLETRTVGVGETIECRNIGIGDFGISDGYLCDRCYNVKTTSVGCGDGQANTKNIGVGEESIDQESFCDRCSNVQTRTVGTGDMIEVTSVGTGDVSLQDKFVCEVCCSTMQHKTEHLTVKEAAVTAQSISVLESRVIISDNQVLSEEKPENYHSVKCATRTIGVGNCGIMDSFCKKCDNVRTRSIGVGNANVSVDLVCDRCAHKKTKSVGTDCDFIETRSLGVSECCITDNYCDRCMNVRTQTVAVGDCCVTDSYCERCFHVQMHSVGVGDFDVNVVESAPMTQTNLARIDSNDNFVDGNMNVKTPSMTGYTLVSHIQSQQSRGGRSIVGVKKGLVHSKESDAYTSDGSIDNDNPSSDSASQTSEVLDTSQSPDRIRITDEVVVACKLLNGHLYKGKEIGREQMISCMSTVENNWFRCVSSRDCDTETIKSLLKTFKNQIHMLLETVVNLADNNGNNALHYAVSFRNWKLADVLLDTGLVNLNLPNKAGYTPIMMAALAGVAKEGDKDIVRKLLKSGEVNKQVDETGQTPLMLAVGRGKLEMVELFLETGADVNTTDDDGSTALMCACEHGHLNIAKRLLLEPACDPSLEDSEGSTALSIAMERNFKDIALLIYGNVSFDPVGKPRKKIPGIPCKAS